MYAYVRVRAVPVLYPNMNWAITATKVAIIKGNVIIIYHQINIKISKSYYLLEWIKCKKLNTENRIKWIRKWSRTYLDKKNNLIIVMENVWM